MAEQVQDNQEREPMAHKVDAKPIRWEFDVSTPDVTVIRADSIRAESSSTPKYLAMKSGEIEVYSRVLISVEGEWYEITKDSPESLQA